MPDAPVKAPIPIDANGTKVNESVVWTRYFADVGSLLETVDTRSAGVWEPLVNGDVDDPEIIFANGEVLMAFRPLT
ncbi:MAG: hypothetical protein PHC88_05545 [Terrimicrobiaceae bacterium]|nr:hypothetical protein [Terrimicrobiaceae bacterium]